MKANWTDGIFYPIYEVNGTSRSGDPEGKHGGSLARRLAYKMGLIRRLESFPGRAVVVVGARNSADLETFKTAIDFIPSNNFIVILWPPDASVPDQSELPSRFSVHFLPVTRPDLVDALVEAGAPKPEATPTLGIRYGRSTLELREDDLIGIDQDFVLIRDNDFISPTPVGGDANALERLWRMEPHDWTPFASEMVFQRNYCPLPDANEDLTNFVTSRLRELADSERVLNVTLTIPATSGSGVTTAIRHAAYFAAQSGFPALLCKPESQNFSVERLGAFLTRLQERSRDQFGRGDPPALIIFDREHRGIEQVSDLAATLASRGRHALVVVVIPPGSDDSEASLKWRPRGRHLTAEEFRGIVEDTELRKLARHFSNIFQRLNISIPTLDDWFAYQQRQTVRTPSGDRPPDSLFWIALRFFVGEGNPHFNLAEWVGRTYEERIHTPAARQAVKFIATFSNFGIAVPLVPLLRAVGTTKTLDTSILPTLRQLTDSEDLLQWGDSEEYLQDQTITFKHRLIAMYLLSYLHDNTWDQRLRECWNLLESLEASPLADTWLVETLVFEALRVDRFESSRLPIILETMDHIPSIIAGRSAPTQHHWGRALALQARHTEAIDKKIVIYSQAIDKLVSACTLAEGEKGREHPRNIYNSLGVNRFELSRVLRDCGETNRSASLWQSAAAAFESALGLGSDNFVVLSAYARRLIEHAREIDDDFCQVLSEVVSALTYLQQAETSAILAESLSSDDDAYIQMERNNAWQLVDPSRAEHHIQNLIKQGDEIGYLLRAYKALQPMNRNDWQEGTAPALKEAHSVLTQANTAKLTNRSWRSVFLYYRVVSALSSQRYNFPLRLHLLDQLDVTGFRWHSALRFAQAVLCYQTGEFLRGFNIFRNLRSGIRSGEFQPIRLTSFWRDPHEPLKPRQASIKIQRLTSEWVAYGDVSEMDGQSVLVRPRWFDVQPKAGDIRQCHLLFELNGPLAVPTSRRVASLID